MAAVSEERFSRIENLIKESAQANAAALTRMEKYLELALNTIQDYEPRLTAMEARIKALQETRRDEFVQTLIQPSELQPHEPTPHLPGSSRKGEGGGGLGAFSL